MQSPASFFILTLALIGSLAAPSGWAKSGGESKAGPSAHVLVVNLNRSPQVSAGARKLARTLESMHGAIETSVVHYRKILENPARFSPAALVLSPQGDPWASYPRDELRDLGSWVRRYRGPILGVCGGHQFLAIAFGGTVAPMRGELSGETYAGLARERGPTRIQVIETSPWFPETPKGGNITVMENHVEEIKRLPDGFSIVARGDVSPAQAIAHRERPILGVQFHPENATDKHPEGRQVLRAFVQRIQTVQATRAGPPAPSR